MSYITIVGPYNAAMLPLVKDFRVMPVREQLSVKALAGNVIRGGTNLHVSSAEPTYTGDILKSDADALDTINEATDVITLAVGEKIYETKFYPTFSWSDVPGKVHVEIKFGIIRKIA